METKRIVYWIVAGEYVRYECGREFEKGDDWGSIGYEGGVKGTGLTLVKR